jgi:hypothetical protein
MDHRVKPGGDEAAQRIDRLRLIRSQNGGLRRNMAQTAQTIRQVLLTYRPVIGREWHFSKGFYPAPIPGQSGIMVQTDLSET